MKKSAFKFNYLAMVTLCALIGLGTACAQKEKKGTESPETAATDSIAKTATAQAKNSSDEEQQQREEASKAFCRQFSVKDLLVLLNMTEEDKDTQQTGLALIYSDSAEGEEEEGLEGSELDVTCSEVVYGRDIEKTTKKELGYQLKATTGHACFFNMSWDTSTQASLNFSDKDDAEDFMERAAKHEKIELKDSPYWFRLDEKNKHVHIEIPWTEDEHQTKYELYPPVLKEGFYSIEVEVYV